MQQSLVRLGRALADHGRVMLRGCAQLAFCDSPSAGVLILGGIALASPFSALGALLGAAFGTVVGRLVPAYGRDEWSWGLATFNPAIVGLFFGGFLASGELQPVLLVPVLALTLLLDIGLRPVLARFMLPSLSTAAVTTLYTVSALAAPPGGWFWTDAPTNPLVPVGLLGGGCILAAIIMKSPFAGLWATLLGAITALSLTLAGHDPRAAFGLWAITVPLASFGVHAIFLRGSLAGCVAGTLAALIGALVWLAWEASFLKHWLPPLLAPFILGTWSSMVLMRRVMGSPLGGPAFWRAARAVLAAQAVGRDVVALLGAGTTRTPDSARQHVGAWLDTELPRFAFERDSLRASPRLRREFWEACARMRETAKHSPASELAHRVGRLYRRGWVQTVIVIDPLVPSDDMLPGDAVRLHGDVRITRCMDCGTEGSWPPASAWRRCDLRCADCQGPVVPAVTIFGALPDSTTASLLRDLPLRSGAILVLGEETVEPEIRQFLDDARQAGAATILISERPETETPQRADTVVRMTAERFLAWMEVLLVAGHALSRPWRGRAIRPRTPAMGSKRSREAAG